MTEGTNVKDKSVKIALLNDAARSNAVNYMATKGILALSERDVSEIFCKVQNFTEFTEDNDPYGEHDFELFDEFNEELEGRPVSYLGL